MNEDLSYDDPDRWMVSRSLMLFTWLVFTVSVFFLFMVFMNFIIAVIGDSFNRVSEYKNAHDYQQRMAMVYEREALFSPRQFEEDKKCFPPILIIRQKKEAEKLKNNWQSYIMILKNFIKVQSNKCLDTITSKSKEQKQHFSNSIKILENDIHTINKDIEKIFNEV